MVAELKRLGPFGQGNRKPILHLPGLTLAGPPRKVGKSGDHLQLFVRQRDGTQFGMKCIAFNHAHRIDELTAGTTIDLAVEPTVNEYNGNVSVELQVKDVRVHA